MKLKFKLMTVFAALGVASSGFAAWNFATATSGEANIPVGIEAAVGSIGSIDFDEIGTYNLADTPNPLVFKGKFNPASGVNLAEVNLTYKVTLNSALADLIDFGSASEGVWVSDVATSITPTWKAGKNPGDLAAYNAIKANLANLSMNVTLSASKKDGSEPIAPIEIVPGALPAGLVVGPGGLIEFDKDLGPVQLLVQGLDEHGNPDGVAQNFVWTSSEPTRASVVDGLVTPLADGNVTITATAATLSGKGLKKAEGAPAKYDFNFNIVGFTLPEPVPASIKLVLPEGIENNHEMEIGDTLNVSAVVLDEEGNIMPELIVEVELLDDETASYIGGVLTALAAVEENTILFSYEGLENVYFDFSIAAAPIINLVDHIEINGNKPLTVEVDAIGQLDIKVYDASNNVLPDETVTLASSNEDVFIVEPDGSYLAGDPGTAVVTATSSSKPEVSGSLSVTVEPKPIQYHTVIIKYNNGSEDTQLQVAHNDSIAKPADPTREGYSFAGWTKDGEEYDFGDAVVGGFILNATWTQNTYTVIFDTDGGAPVPADRNIAHGEAIEEPDTPTKDGYSFVGWYVGASETVYQWETPVTSSFTITARWNVIKYTVTYDSNGGSEVASQTINYGELFTDPGAPTKEGFEFMGWLHNGVPFKFTDAVTGDVDLVANWKAIEEEDEGFNLHIDFSNLIGKGAAISSTTDMLSKLQSSEQKAAGDPSQILSVTNISGNVYDGNGSGGAPFDAATGLIKLGKSKAGGGFTFVVSSNVHTVRVLATGWTAAEGLLSVNNSATQNAPFNTSASLAKGWMEFPLDVASDTITLDSAAKRIRIFEIELIGGPVVPLANLASVAISSASGASVEEKQNLQLSAVVEDVDGETVDNATLAWESLNADIATVNNNGLVSALVPGTAMIKVTATRMESEVESQFAVTVTARPAGVPNKVVIVGHEVENPTLTIPLANATVSLQAKVFNQYNEEMTGVDLVWESSDTAVATVANGVVSLVSDGTATIKVSVDGDAAIFVELALTVDAAAQEEQYGEEDFESQTALGTGYGAGSFTGNSGVVFNYVESRNEGLGTADDYHIDGKGIMLRRPNEPSELSFTLTNGLKKLEFDYMKAFTGNSVRNINIAINGVVVETISATLKADEVLTYVYEPATALTGNVTVRIFLSGNDGNSQVTLDNIKWTY